MDTEAWKMLLRYVREHRPDIVVDSRKVTQGAVFVLSRSGYAGDAYAQDAAARGAAFVVADEPLPSSCCRMVLVQNPRRRAAELSAARFDTDRLPFPLIGVTGTNGKTTTTYLLERLLTAKGIPAGVIGTIAVRWPGHEEEACMTTPDAPVLHEILFRMRQAGVRAAAMEVSSHALDQDRVACVPFDGAVFTNLTQDHLDYHKTFENYFAAKRRLFTELPKTDKACAIGTDGSWGGRLAEAVAGCSGTARRMVTFGLNDFAIPKGSRARHLRGCIASSTTDGLHLTMRLKDENGVVDEWDARSPLVGAFNAENLLAVQAIALGFGFTPRDFACLERFNGVPGRLERIPNGRNLDIFVDYAHTPDALTNALRALRGAGFRRIVCVFGCGGNRDTTKRPLMGQAVAADADAVVLTSDNPRHEAPLAIIDDVLPGLHAAKSVVVEPDRRDAIAKAIAMTLPGDALLVAGKGHERTQQIGDVKHPFSDQETIAELCPCR